jgi:hypothetical protein
MLMEAGERLLSERGDAPETLEFRRRLRQSRFAVRDSAGTKLRTTIHNAKGDHCELRFQAKGAQTVMPPSIHHSGDRYVWTPGHSPDDGPAAIAPAWLIDELTEKPKPARRNGALLNSQDDTATAISALWALGANRADRRRLAARRNGAADRRSVRDAGGVGAMVAHPLPDKYRDGGCRAKWSFNGHSNVTRSGR